MKKITITQDEIKTQKHEILYHLKTENSITSWEAIQQYGATRLSGVIWGLRNEGYQIDSVDEEHKTKWGRNIKITRYYYIEPIRKNFQRQPAIVNHIFTAG